MDNETLIATAITGFAILFGAATCEINSFACGFFAGMATFVTAAMWYEEGTRDENDFPT